jgi:hypothetical protein
VRTQTHKQRNVVIFIPLKIIICFLQPITFVFKQICQNIKNQFLSFHVYEVILLGGMGMRMMRRHPLISTTRVEM